MQLRAPSKTFFLGEYAVLKHGQAIVMATTPYFTLHFDDSEKPCPLEGPIQQLSSDLKLTGWNWYDPHQQQGGLGASSAVFAMILYYQQLIQKQPIDSEKIWSIYQQYHQSQTTSPSGADILCQLHGGLTVMNTPKATAQPWPFKQLSWSVYRTGLSSNTHDVLKPLPESSAKHMNAIVNDGIDALNQQNNQLFINSIINYHQAMIKENCYHPSLAPIFNILSEHEDILAFKGCGALGMDTFLVLYATESTPLVHAHLDKLFTRIAHTPDIAHGVHQSQGLHHV
ncbi:MAG: hypothetical protein ACON5A_01570 [Candidatus Comchoanobacterales bacterium]